MKRIGLFLAESSWGAIDERAMSKGLGGRETALVALAQEFSNAGIEVYAFVPRDKAGIARYENIRWVPNGYVIEMACALELDLFVSWENTQVLEELREQGFDGITAIEMQVAHLHSDAPVSSVADYVCVLSQWAADFFVEQHPDCHDIMVVFPNGIDAERFKIAAAHSVKSDPIADGSDFHFIYSSSPDRGLHHLLAMWPEIQNRITDEYQTGAHLHVCYGAENFVQNSMWSHREDALRALTIKETMDQPGVIYHGKIGQDELAALMVDCDLMLYPCDTMSPTETGCISICEALAAGTPVVTTDCDCIGPDYGHVTTQIRLPFAAGTYGIGVADGYERFIDKIIDTLNPEDYMAQVEIGLEFVERRFWSTIAPNWIAFFDQVISERRPAAV